MKLSVMTKVKGTAFVFCQFISLGLLSCGGDDKKAESNGDFKSATADFSESEKGQQFVLMPYVLGDISKVEGGSSTITFSITGTQSSGAKLTDMQLTDNSISNPRIKQETIMSDDEIGHNLRTLLNRFDSDLGFFQGEWFWRLAKKVDQSLMTLSLNEQGSGYFLNNQVRDDIARAYWSSEDRIGPVEAEYLAQLEVPVPSYLKAFVSQKRSGFKVAPEYHMTAGVCPKAGENVYLPLPSNPSEMTTAKVPTGGAVEGTDYCIVYLTDPVSEPSKDNIKKSVETIMKTYKKVVYKSDFETTSGGFVFKPVIVILDFKNESVWPKSTAYQVDGAFLPNPTKTAKMPMLYMTSDLNAIKARDATLTKKLFHSTLAHEMQHAISNYYRVHKTEGVLENPSIDEGLAHFMEDLFGFGAENFTGYTKSFMDVWMEDSFPPILHGSEAGDINRGASQALWYYLFSQKGGAIFSSDGLVSGGDGLKYIADVVTNAKVRGPKGLSEKFGGDWAVTMGEFFVALAVDNTTIPENNEKFKVKEPQSMKNLLGSTAKFGMRFNNFGDLPASKKFTEKKFTSGEGHDVTFYSAVPLFYEVADPSVKIGFKTSTDQGEVYLARVRIK